MFNILEAIRDVGEKIAKNGGKPIPANVILNCKSLERRGYVKMGTSNDGRVAWLTNKAYNEIEDNED